MTWCNERRKHRFPAAAEALDRQRSHNCLLTNQRLQGTDHSTLYAFGPSRHLAGSDPSGDPPDVVVLPGFIGRNKAVAASLVAALRFAPRPNGPMPRHLRSCLSKVKSYLSGLVADLFNDLNVEKLRIARPSKELFLCGGIISSDSKSRPQSVRDYIYRLNHRISSLNAKLILAEAANRIYRDTHYHDLISFEEDIAKLVALIVVVAESPGSLAELGAFASISNIRDKLVLLVRQKHAEDESFIRYGPIERLRNGGSGLVGFFPWNVNSVGLPVVKTLSPHKAEIIRFINDHLAKTPATELISNIGDTKYFFIIYWIVYVAFAISQSDIHEITEALGLQITANKIRDILFCLELVGWIARELYAGTDYFYSLYNKDPFDYSFKSGVRVTDSARRKAEISEESRKAKRIPKHVGLVVASKRAPT